VKHLLRGGGGWLAFLVVCWAWAARSEPKPLNQTVADSGDVEVTPWEQRDLALATYYQATATVSTIVRQLAFVGIAVVWLFSGVDLKAGDGLDVPEGLLWPGVLLIVALILDLVQYVVRTVVWGFWAWRLHKRQDKYRELAPGWFNVPTLVLFYSKIVSIVLAYMLLSRYLYQLMPT
jgi:hypothetical protein